MSVPTTVKRALEQAIEKHRAELFNMEQALANHLKAKADVEFMEHQKREQGTKSFIKSQVPQVDNAQLIEGEPREGRTRHYKGGYRGSN